MLKATVFFSMRKTFAHTVLQKFGNMGLITQQLFCERQSCQNNFWWKNRRKKYMGFEFNHLLTVWDGEGPLKIK
jgi:hypothetical protein